MTTALNVEDIDIDTFCVGKRWTVADLDQLTKLIAVIAMGQATYASYIIHSLLPAEPNYTFDELKTEAIISLSIQEKPQSPRIGYPRAHRDGFIFEAVSWIAARQALGQNALLKAPHVSATSQGIDGLMIEMNPEKTEITFATIFEDKCTDSPRDTFQRKVLMSFKDRHQNKRSAELVAAASALIKIGGLDDAAASAAAKGIMDRTKRKYRAAFALPMEYDSSEERQALFKDYDALDNLVSEQRIGASFLVSQNMRDAFDEIATLSVQYIKTLTPDQFNV